MRLHDGFEDNENVVGTLFLVRENFSLHLMIFDGFTSKLKSSDQDGQQVEETETSQDQQGEIDCSRKTHYEYQVDLERVEIDEKNLTVMFMDLNILFQVDDDMEMKLLVEVLSYLISSDNPCIFKNNISGEI